MVHDVLSGAKQWDIINADVCEGLAQLPDQCIQTVVTSPPYWRLRSYGTIPQDWGDWIGELGLEPTLDLYISHLVTVFNNVWRVLRNDGTVWLNIGDSYAGYHGNSKTPKDKAPSNKNGYIENQRESTVGKNHLKQKDLALVPEHLVIALQQAGWYVRSRIAWMKTNPMPEAVKDRPTSAWEYIFLLSKSPKYFYDAYAVRQPHTDSRVVAGKWSAAGGMSKKVEKRLTTDPEHVKTLAKGTYHREYNPAGANLRNWWNLQEDPPEHQSWIMPTEQHRGTHYATYPTELVKRCVLAGTSERGCCYSCGSPYSRSIDIIRDGETQGNVAKLDKLAQEGQIGGMKRIIDGPRLGKKVNDTISHLDWKPTCKCQQDMVQSCIVLDPFCGSGTTGVVAKHLNRRFIGIELLPEYVQMATERINGA